MVFDLRNDIERLRRPNRLPPGIEVLERTSPGSSEGRTTEEAIAAGDVPDRDDAYMTSVYVDVLTRLAPELRILVERSAAALERPLLFHCAAGKDRTGVAAALLLGLLGVPDETILDDYELTTAHSPPHRLAALRPVLIEHLVPEERVRPLFEARRPVLASTLIHLDEEFGGFEKYAVDVLGVVPTLPEQLRETLLARRTDKTWSQNKPDLRAPCAGSESLPGAPAERDYSVLGPRWSGSGRRTKMRMPRYLSIHACLCG